MQVLLMRFDAPLMSFGGVKVDQLANTDRFPSVSLLTGLLGNALGYNYRDGGKLSALQENLDFAARWDVAPSALRDYQTVDTAKPHMNQLGWTTRGLPEDRVTKGDTIQRYVHYWANGIMTVAIMLKADKDCTVEDLKAALQRPSRPIFIGRKTCFPSTPLFIGIADAENVLEALSKTPPATRDGKSKTMEACWPEHLGEQGLSCSLKKTQGSRNWRNRLHLAKTLRYEGLLTLN